MADLIDKKLVAPIDAGDNGISLFEKKSDIGPYLIQHFFSVMQPTWNEEDENVDEIFLECVEKAKEILMREIIHGKDAILAESLVMEIYQKTEDKRILLLDKNYPEETFRKLPEILFVIYPRKVEYWGVRAVKDSSQTFKNRKDFLSSWAGLRDEELQKITGVSDAVFCHRGLFLAVAKTKGGAIKLAQIAVES